MIGFDKNFHRVKIKESFHDNINSGTAIVAIVAIIAIAAVAITFGKKDPPDEPESSVAAVTAFAENAAENGLCQFNAETDEDGDEQKQPTCHIRFAPTVI